jgi:hypothetical protein
MATTAEWSDARQAPAQQHVRPGKGAPPRHTGLAPHPPHQPPRRPLTHTTRDRNHRKQQGLHRCAHTLQPRKHHGAHHQPMMIPHPLPLPPEKNSQKPSRQWSAGTRHPIPLAFRPALSAPPSSPRSCSAAAAAAAAAAVPCSCMQRICLLTASWSHHHHLITSTSSWDVPCLCDPFGE